MSLITSIPLIGDLINSIGKGLDELFTSDEERGQIDIEKKKIELQTLVTQLKSQHEQLKINLVQANHKSIFVAGARPAIIWIGAIGLLYESILRPVFSFLSQSLAMAFVSADDMRGMIGGDPTEDNVMAALETYIRLYQLPGINTELFLPIVLGILGIGTMRSVEKIQGKARETLRAGDVELQHLANVMTKRLKEDEERLDRAASGNASIDDYRRAAAQEGYKPFFPSAEQVLR